MCSTNVLFLFWNPPWSFNLTMGIRSQFAAIWAAQRAVWCGEKDNQSKHISKGMSNRADSRRGILNAKTDHATKAGLSSTLNWRSSG